jgi:outer membrane protein OmpA-like peptidoglycan-associated protein
MNSRESGFMPLSWSALLMNLWRYNYIILLLAASGVLQAQVANPTSDPNAQHSAPPGPVGTYNGEPLYKIQVVSRELPAINYFHRNGSTKIGFQGTNLLPEAKGWAKVDSKLGRTVIEVDVEGLTPANSFGTEYLTYVLWAITPEGRPVNLGEVLPTGSNDSDHLTVTTNLQAFGLIVTAEPYFAVTMPSDVVVMQNLVINDKTQGVIEQVNAHYSLLPRGSYEEIAGRHAVLHPITRDERSPLELYEAVNAVQIADADGAEKYAADSMASAKTALQNAEDINQGGHHRKETITYAREAVQAAEDARIITIRKIKAADAAAEQQARLNAEQAAQQSKEAAEQARINAERQAAQREQAQAEAAQAQAQAAEAQARAEKARAAQQAAEQSAQLATQQAEQERERLKQQLNQVLQTTETARGLIVNMSDVLFGFNQYNLKPEAREKLAKVSGILLAYPNLKLQVEGYTDNIGSDEYNQKLSQERADTVRDYLASQGVSSGNISAAGYGENDPLADNSTASGRAENRRVQLVVSGSSIGIQQSAPGAQSQTAPSTDEHQQPQGNPPQTPVAPANPSGVSDPPQ